MKGDIMEYLSILGTVSPKDQETFQSTNWTQGNTGITKKYNYNNDFKMIYRVVDTTQNSRDRMSGPDKNSLETRINTEGQEHTMGVPYSVSDPDPLLKENKLTLFSNLQSIQAARLDYSSLNIGYDCEYQACETKRCPVSFGEERIILSYQFALYLNEKDILEVVFLTKRPEVKNRLSLRTCIGSILDLLIKEFNKAYVSFTYQSTRRHKVVERKLIFEGSDDSYKHTEIFNTKEEADNYIASQNPLVVLDYSKGKKNDFGASKKEALSVTLVCHSGIVDVSAFKDDIYGIGKNGSMLPVFKSIQGGLVTMESIFTNVPTASEYWKYYPVNIGFRDTMCYAPAGEKSLAILGKTLGVDKIKLPDGAIENMMEYLNTNPADFLSYAAQDALITVMYGSRLWGINKKWSLTSTSASASVMKKFIYEYLGINTKDKKAKQKFERMYRGMTTISRGRTQTPSGYRPLSETIAINPDAELLHNFAANSYCGGYNTCIYPGVFRNSYFYDFDLESAYPTAMCLVMDIDFDSDYPIEREFKNEPLTLQAFHTPMDPMFCYVDFEFPEYVAFPCIAIHDESSIIFPRTGKGVYVSGPSLYLALKLGAKIFVHRGYVARIRLTENGSPSMSLRVACKQMVQDRNTAKHIYGKGSLEELLLKLFVNGAYGKIAQNVIEKSTWDGWNEYMTDIGFSSITSPERAALITDIVRCMLIGTLNQLNDRGINSYSVTTDGFITEATLDELNSCDAYGFKNYFEQSRAFLTDGDPTVWAAKHEQTDLVNPTTRCNTGFGVDKEKADTVITAGLGVLAHGGYVSGEVKDSFEDKLKTTEVILTRTGRIPNTVTEFVNLKDMMKVSCDFHTFRQDREIRLDFDMKRKPVKSSFEYVSGNLYGIEYEYANFRTAPFNDLEEYHLYRNANKCFDCIRTKSDWDRFFLKLNDRSNGYKRVTKDMEWAKLFSVIQGYRTGLWDIPEITAAESLADKLAVINKYNHSNKAFNENAWKNSRKPERASQMLPVELIQDLLQELNYIEK